MKALVIEDNPDINEILCYILKEEGHEVVACMDGTTLNSLDQIKPDVILMDDIIYPDKGSELCTQLKSKNNVKNIPVILMSGRPDLASIAERCGADAYIEKPFSVEYLIEVIEKFNVSSG